MRLDERAEVLGEGRDGVGADVHDARARAELDDVRRKARQPGVVFGDDARLCRRLRALRGARGAVVVHTDAVEGGRDVAAELVEALRDGREERVHDGDAREHVHETHTRVDVNVSYGFGAPPSGGERRPGDLPLLSITCRSGNGRVCPRRPSDTSNGPPADAVPNGTSLMRAGRRVRTEFPGDRLWREIPGSRFADSVSIANAVSPIVVLRSVERAEPKNDRLWSRDWIFILSERPTPGKNLIFDGNFPVCQFRAESRTRLGGGG